MKRNPYFYWPQVSVFALGLMGSVADGNAQPVSPSTNGLQTSPVVATRSADRPLDPFERYAVGIIEEYKLKLKDPALDAATRLRLTASLGDIEASLEAHRLSLRKQEVFVEALEREGKALEELEKVRRASAELSGRSAIDLARTTELASLAVRQTNIQLWQNLTKARQKRDAGLIAKSERELADHLTKKLEWIDNKDYPTGMALAKVLSYYKNHPLAKSTRVPISKKQVGRIVLIALFILPVLVSIYFHFRGKKTTASTDTKN